MKFLWNGIDRFACHCSGIHNTTWWNGIVVEFITLPDEMEFITLPGICVVMECNWKFKINLLEMDWSICILNLYWIIAHLGFNSNAWSFTSFHHLFWYTYYTVNVSFNSLLMKLGWGTERIWHPHFYYYRLVHKLIVVGHVVVINHIIVVIGIRTVHVYNHYNYNSGNL